MKKNKDVDNPVKEDRSIPEAEFLENTPETEEEKTEMAGGQVETEGTIDEWREALEIAVKQRDEYLDSLRRAQADFQNFRRRNQTARADGYEDGVREAIAELLPAVDNLERAIDSTKEDSPLLEGVKMTLSQLLEAMKRFGLEEIQALNMPFDPELHNAVLKEATDDPGKVIEVLQKGYGVKDKIIRYAMVKVSVEE